MWTDDPVKDAIRYDEELHELSAQYPCCDRCGERVKPDEYVYDINGDLWCEDCIRKARFDVEEWMEMRG